MGNALLINLNFSILFFAALLGVLGEGIFRLTAIVIAMEETDSNLGNGKMLVLTLSPCMFLAPFIGVFKPKNDGDWQFNSIYDHDDCPHQLLQMAGYL